MRLSSFGELVALRTKLASILPFLVGVFFAIDFGYDVNWANTIVLFIVTLTLAMATTGISNLVAYNKSQGSVNAQSQTVIGKRQLPLLLVQLMLVVMLTLATCLGIWLVWRTNLMLLLLGIIGFGIAIFYTIGPVPLSRLPLGEVFVGGSLGLLLPFTAFYVNVPSQKLIGIILHWPGMLVMGNLWSLIAVVLLCLPLMATTANLMFAENIVGLRDQTIDETKHTLPEYLGQRWSLIVYRSFLVIGFLGIIIGMATGMLSWWLVVMMVAVPAAVLNDRHFKQMVAGKTTSTADEITTSAHNGLFQKELWPAISNILWVNGSLLLGLILEMVVQ
ncbi:UbiA prenyltransferase family protein [Furfurilactobacillus rossiae]|uniref:UbiA family prenyltransferase n=1 Tax=Furfurilactobacillus rossiae TaxID=231049 RepID=UPI0002E9BE2E|nr:UbiA family prenyltransferase [Furfurilactobacillus rossiae]QFR65650.1 prenyltransferase [Furfurilactobacillus rossiae]QLE61040.1 prenyltransferase contains 14-dihydroxy-2-naphthoate octaprenyltransferase domain [Furfurilactobacillus rossiae]